MRDALAASTSLRSLASLAPRIRARKPFRRRGLATRAPQAVRSLQLGTDGLDLFARDLDGQLSRENQSLPRFAAAGERIRLLSEPSEFYRWLLDRIPRAKRRIFLSALYIGKEETELVEALHRALAASDTLELHIVADWSRSLREGPGKCSAALLAKLVADFPHRVQIHLYHAPQLTKFVKMVVPRRMQEGWGVWHTKIVGIDDDLLVSGANLSRDYFVNRQDRYMVIEDHPPLADYYAHLLRTAASFSYCLDSASTSHSLSLIWHNRGDEPDRPQGDFVARTKTAWAHLRRAWYSRSAESRAGTGVGVDSDTAIYPFHQANPFDLVEESGLVLPGMLFGASHPDARIDVTTGYFSLDWMNRKRLLANEAQIRLICASPEANGFYGSKGVSGYLPAAYTWMERSFREAAKRAGRLDRIEMREWKRPDWTYHAKGFWVSPANDAPPSLTVIGSSNYGRRSTVRDVETNLLVTTTSPTLRAALAGEVDNLREWTEPVDDATFAAPDRRVALGVKLAARMLRDKL